MKNKVFFDSNILIYLFDISEPEKRSIAKQLLLKEIENNNELYISSQVVNEFINGVTRKVKKNIPFEYIEKHLNFIKNHFIVNPLNLELSFYAVKLKLKYRYSYYDSLILASALESNCNILYTEDLQDRQLIEGSLTIFNPFKTNQ